MLHTVVPHGIASAFSAVTTSSAEKAAAAQKIRMDSYTTTVNQLIAAHPEENITVSTIDLSSGSALTLGDKGTYTAASTAKIITAVTLLHEVEEGQMSLSTEIDGQTAQDLLQNMIINSDNDAWHSLNDYMTHDALAAYMTQLGWTHYDTDNNTLLPSEMASLVQKLYKGQILDQAHTQQLLALMQQANKQEYIVDSVPAGYTVYHKAGWLDGLMHDVAVVSNGKKAIVLAIYTYNNNSDNNDNPASQALFKQITDAALQAYFPASDSQN